VLFSDRDQPTISIGSQTPRYRKEDVTVRKKEPVPSKTPREAGQKASDDAAAARQRARDRAGDDDLPHGPGTARAPGKGGAAK
jgi:hypothetical protein